MHIQIPTAATVFDILMDKINMFAVLLIESCKSNLKEAGHSRGISLYYYHDIIYHYHGISWA